MLLLDELSATCLRHVAYPIVKTPRGRSKFGLILWISPRRVPR